MLAFGSEQRSGWGRGGLERQEPLCDGNPQRNCNKKHAWGSPLPLILRQISGGIYSLPGTWEMAAILMGMMDHKQDKEETLMLVLDRCWRNRKALDIWEMLGAAGILAVVGGGEGLAKVTY